MPTFYQRFGGSARSKNISTLEHGVGLKSISDFQISRVLIQDAGWDGGQHAMARSYSLDLRERVDAAVAAGQSCRKVASTFGVSVASVVKWSQRFRATGSAAARRMGGNRPYALAGERDWLLGRLAKKPDVTLRGLVGELAERGLVVSYYAALLRARRLQKKAYTPASRIVPTSQSGGRDGSGTRASLIQPVSSSSMRPGP
jgi:transposase